MDMFLKELIWRQFGGALEMLENAIKACPDEMWGDRSQFHEYWYMCFHTLFWTDLYLSGTAEGFRPPEPYTLDELDPAGVLPDRVYTKQEMLEYLEHCRNKCRMTVAGLSEEGVMKSYTFRWGEVSFVELLLYNMRHVQHHAAQMNLLLRQRIDSAPRWVGGTLQQLS